MKLLVLNNLSSGLGDGAVYDFMRAFAQPEDEFIVRCVDQNSSFADALADVGDFDALIAADQAEKLRRSESSDKS